ncbi:ClpX-type ZB domain-containing protein, partial [Dysosmobacter welbionis]
KIPQLLKLLNQGIFLECVIRQCVQNPPQGHVNFIPLLGFDKAHLVEGLGVCCNRIQRLGLGVLARLSGQFHQLGAGLAVLIGCLSRGTDRNMLRTVPASEGIAQVLRQPLRFPGLGDPQVHSRLTFPELLCRFCCRLRQAGHPEPAKLRHLLRSGDVVRPEAEQVEGGKVRQLPELSHSREVLQISRRAPEPQLLQVGMDSSQSA